MKKLNNTFNNSEPNETFEDVKEFLSNIDYINSGGCGLSALVMYRWLKKYDKLTEDIKIIFLDNDEYNYKNNKECMTNKQGVLEAPSHVIMLLKGNVNGLAEIYLGLKSCLTLISGRQYQSVQLFGQSQSAV